MIKTLQIIVALFSILCLAQVPQGISYQAVALDANGGAITDTTVSVQISILESTVSGPAIYVERHIVDSNAQGLFTLSIGRGTASSGSFNTIDWASDSKFIKVELDAAGGTNYVLAGTNELLSVPYALAADSLVTSPGEGITLVSPNGTPYQITVNDSGELSLPTSGTQGNSINRLFIYGDFNNWDPASALEFGNSNSAFRGIKYFAAGSEFKMLTGRNENVVYGANGANDFGTISLTGTNFVIPTSGFYSIIVRNNFDGTYIYNISPGSLNISGFNPNTGTEFAQMTYTPATDNFSIVSSSNQDIAFVLEVSGQNQLRFGDNLIDGILEAGGASINLPANTSLPVTYNVQLNFNLSGTWGFQ